jgi:hypothetical protein
LGAKAKPPKASTNPVHSLVCLNINIPKKINTPIWSNKWTNFPTCFVSRIELRGRDVTVPNSYSWVISCIPALRVLVAKKRQRLPTVFVCGATSQEVLKILLALRSLQTKKNHPEVVFL